MWSHCWVLRQREIGSGAAWKVNQGHLRVSPVMYSWLGFEEDSLRLLSKLYFHLS